MTESNLRSWLHQYDPLLVLRRVHINWYAVYRKCAPHAIGLPANPMPWDKYWANKGYFRVLAFRPNHLDQRVMYTIFQRDLQRHPDRYDEIMDNYYKTLAHSKAFRSDERYNMAKDRFAPSFSAPGATMSRGHERTPETRQYEGL